jgi:hypothetical protein
MMWLAVFIITITPSLPSKVSACACAACHAGTAFRSRSLPAVVNTMGFDRPLHPEFPLPCLAKVSPSGFASGSTDPDVEAADFRPCSRFYLTDHHEQGELN